MISEKEVKDAKNLIAQYYQENYPKVDETFLKWAGTKHEKVVDVSKYNNVFFSVVYNKYKEAFGEFLSFDPEIWSNKTGRTMMKDGEEELHIEVRFKADIEHRAYNWEIFRIKIDEDHAESFYDVGRFEKYIDKSIKAAVKQLKKWYQNDRNIIYPDAIREKYNIKRKDYDLSLIKLEDVEELVNKHFSIEKITETVTDTQKQVEFLIEDRHYNGFFKNSIYFNINGNAQVCLHEMYEGGDTEYQMEEEVKDFLNRIR